MPPEFYNLVSGFIGAIAGALLGGAIGAGTVWFQEYTRAKNKVAHILFTMLVELKYSTKPVPKIFEENHVNLWVAGRDVAFLMYFWRCRRQMALDKTDLICGSIAKIMNDPSVSAEVRSFPEVEEAKGHMNEFLGLLGYPKM